MNDRMTKKGALLPEELEGHVVPPAAAWPHPWWAGWPLSPGLGAPGAVRRSGAGFLGAPASREGRARGGPLWAEPAAGHAEPPEDARAGRVATRPRGVTGPGVGRAVQGRPVP